MKVLFVGGTGIISSACTDLAIKRNIDISLLSRGESFRPVPKGAEIIRADIRKSGEAEKALKGRHFDAVVDWICFSEEHALRDIELFRENTEQFVFISSASAYHTPPRILPVSESALLHNPYWQYSRNKIRCEELFINAYRKNGFPITIVRPSHTYDKTLLPMNGGYTDVHRMRKNKRVIIHGDGTSLWTLTHHRDFAVGLVGLLGNMQALGEAFHITSSQWLCWNQIYEIVARAAGAVLDPVYIPSEVINRYDPDWGAGLLGDKTHSMIFDNSKIRSLVPDFNPSIDFDRGAGEIMAWYDADESRRIVNKEYDALVDKIISEYGNC
ncbi:MAG: NAD-dependent epimerase/dehydratase family protein [Spirochaetales bacterium]|nr:NAD-dependent epimerase/dehydratase family protein [Spirochaetales bacterium]